MRKQKIKKPTIKELNKRLLDLGVENQRFQHEIYTSNKNINGLSREKDELEEKVQHLKINLESIARESTRWEASARTLSIALIKKDIFKQEANNIEFISAGQIPRRAGYRGN